jgi:hypothetical protein
MLTSEIICRFHAESFRVHEDSEDEHDDECDSVEEEFGFMEFLVVDRYAQLQYKGTMPTPPRGVPGNYYII